MELYSIEQLSFSYPGRERQVLKDLSFTLKKGEFVVLCGPSGCGKTSLLRQLKTVLSPHGSKSGRIIFVGKALEDWSQREQASKIGFVLQSPENQVVTDKVWHELAFGLESLGYDNAEIRLKVAEMASFLGIEPWFHQTVAELSGGQKQLLSLASVLVMQPEILILDEPTSQLDPIAAAEFLSTIGRINRELGITIFLTEQRLEEVITYAHRLIAMDRGELIADGHPKEVGVKLREQNHGLWIAMPTPMRVWGAVPSELSCPLSVQEGRAWLDAFAATHLLEPIAKDLNLQDEAVSIITLKNIWFRYAKESPDVLKGLTISIPKGHITALLGGNGTGKTTTLSLLTGKLKPQRGNILLDGNPLMASGPISDLGIGLLPQNPQTMFVRKTVLLDLLEQLDGQALSEKEKQRRVQEVSELCKVGEFLQSHPFDLSGGELQRAAFAKVLLMEPRILLLDEPTKGMDGELKAHFAQLLRQLKAKGISILMVSHDVEFCAQYSDYCAFMFDGCVITQGEPHRFFAGNSFYTTAANRMARHQLPGAITTEDICKACGAPLEEWPQSIEQSKPSPITEDTINTLHVLSQQDLSQKQEGAVAIGKEISLKTKLATACMLLLIPLTIWLGIHYLDDRKYYFISLLVILESMVPFFLAFEGRRPKARELVVLAVLCGIGIAGRAAFFWFPQFKPVVALVVITGAAFGGQAGFLVGTLTGFLSGFFFGQGPWTPWQMFAYGLIGLISAMLLRKGDALRRRIPLSLLGGLMAFLVYGGIMDTSTALTVYSAPTFSVFLTTYLLGVPFNLIHGVATVIFLYVAGPMMLEKLERIKTKYGLADL